MSGTFTSPLMERQRPPQLPASSHVQTMCDEIGIFEHAYLATPRHEHGYCTDDVARLLIAILREPTPRRELLELARTCFRFLAESQGATGRTRNRRSAGGRWHGRRGVDDCWGRSVWAFGTAARLAPEPWMRSGGLSYFDFGARQRSPHRRAMAFAALGAAEVLATQPRHLAARQLLADAAHAIGPVQHDHEWLWPEPRLSYANAALAEVMIAAGHLLEREEWLSDGLAMLRWLIVRQTVDGHLSPVPVGGAGPNDWAPAFDQQPIEIAALADASVRAAGVAGDAEWRATAELSIAWFEGQNDLGVTMSDPITGGGFDGLTSSGTNLNQGAESTLALITTLQHGLRWAIEVNPAPTASAG